MHTSSIRGALAHVFQIPLRPSLLGRAVQAVPTSSTMTLRASGASSSKSSFSTSAVQNKRQKGSFKPDRRITLIRFFLHHPTTLTPRPLRFSRNRFLRHWTITRAWNLYRHKVKALRQLELERQYNAMRDANEELRVGAGDGGRLFRKAQMKTGIWGIGGPNGNASRKGGVPIEYARGLVEWVGSTGGLGVGSAGQQEGAEGEVEEGQATTALTGKEAKIWDYAWKRY